MRRSRPKSGISSTNGVSAIAKSQLSRHSHRRLRTLATWRIASAQNSPSCEKLFELDQAVRVRVAEESASALAVALEFPAIPEPDELEAKAQQFNDQIRARQERDREAAEVEQLRLRAEATRGVASNASAAVDQAQRDRDETRSSWSAWKVATGCPESLRPDTAQQLFASVERLRERVAQLDSMDAGMARIADELHVFSQAIHDLAKRVGAAPGSDTQLAEDTLESLLDRVKADATLRVEQAQGS